MKIKVYNPSDFIRVKEPVTVGIPCPQGRIKGNDSFVFSTENQVIPAQSSPLILWPDNSVKWLLCDFIVDMEAKQCLELSLQKTKAKTAPVITYHLQDDKIVVDTGKARFFLDTSSMRPFQQVWVNDASLLNQEGNILSLIDQNGRELAAIIDQTKIETDGPVRLTVGMTGHFGDKKRILFRAKIHFYAESARTSLELTIHNPKAAKHPSGIWDLGDPASFLFRELSFSMSLSKSSGHSFGIRQDSNSDWFLGSNNSSLKIYQESSGGKQWDSPNHRNRDGKVPMKVRGYKIEQDSNIISKGERAQPVIWTGNKQSGISIVVPRFWQEFPKALTVDRHDVNVALYPSDFPDLHELQGGEQKTHYIYWDFATPQQKAGWGHAPLQVTLDPRSVNDSKILKDIICGATASPNYQEYIDTALNGEQSFFAKRENVDEYGWRNFGDLYADHEAAYHKDKKPFVSHYNNQYDPIASFYREFIRTGDSRWSVLAGDLARHVIDIDINHTDADKEEYCQGLLWHTDHYLDAGLATHRMASKEHLQHKDPNFVGGGPAAQHCYTTGLMYHYLLTGDLRSKETVIRLADWCYLSLRGSQTILAWLIRSKKKIAALRSNKNSLLTRYPFDRGTGNCLTSLLDAFTVSGERAYLSKAEQLIKGTIHPEDDINRRNLENVERWWSYTVVLHAIAKYLHIKLEHNECDDNFHYAKMSLLHYTRWMAENEYPTLEKKEILEYPNETWAAQDFRKGVIFWEAAKFSDNNERQQFINKAAFFQRASFEELKKWPSRHYTRPVVLAMQNAGRDMSVKPPQYVSSKGGASLGGHQPFTPSWSTAIKHITKDFFETLRNTSPNKEWHWLCSRLLN
jgi:hypothetical protein